MAEVRANGVSLYYEEHGTGEPIVCIHGMGSAAAVWEDAVQALAPHGRVIAYDRRGCHRSERPEPYHTDVGQQAEDAAALIEGLHAAPAVVIGRSYGGEIALELARSHPALVRALALLEGAPMSLSEEAARWDAELYAAVVAAGERSMDLVGETLLRTVLGDDGFEAVPEDLKKLVNDNAPAIVAEARSGGLDWGREDLAPVTQPTLVVAARESPPAFAEATRAAADALPAAKLAWVDGDHLIDPAHPRVIEFVDGILGSR